MKAKAKHELSARRFANLNEAQLSLVERTEGSEIPGADALRGNTRTHPEHDG